MQRNQKQEEIYDYNYNNELNEKMKRRKENAECEIPKRNVTEMLKIRLIDTSNGKRENEKCLMCNYYI